MKRQPIYGLDLVRFMAAMLVVLFHFGFKSVTGAPSRLIGLPDMAYPPGWQAIWFGWLGVQIFFVISGLVIGYSAAGATPSRFIVSRVSRLLPAMLIVATYIAVVEMTFYHMSARPIGYLWFKSVTFAFAGPWITGQIWTLPIEICFYAIVFALIVARRAAWLERLAYVLALASAAYWIAVGGFAIVDRVPRLTQLAPLQYGCYFALGILFATRAPGGIRPIRLLAILTCLATAAVQIHRNAVAEAPHPYILAAWPSALATFYAVTALIAASLVFADPVARAMTPSAGVVLRAIGLCTYPLYLIHMHVGGPIIRMLSGRLPYGLVLAIAVIAAVAVSMIVALWLEPPLHRRVKRVVEWLVAQIAGPRTSSESTT